MKSLLSPSIHGRDLFAAPSRTWARWLLGAVLVATTAPALADSFTVNVGTDADQDPAITDHCAALNDTAHCTLRAAITLGNARDGSHTIDIAATLVTVTNGDLPLLMAPFVVNGNQATVDGNGHGCFHLFDSGDPMHGHTDGATGSQLFNLVIGNCSGAGISANGHDYTFSHNHIGVDLTGAVAMPNTGNGIEVSASNPYADTTAGFLDTLYQGFPALPDDDAGIAAFASGLATALATLDPVTISDNLISGNMQNGVQIFSENIGAVIVRDNFIGTDGIGNVAIPNGQNGVHLIGNSFANLIGPGNVVSGNSGNGIFVEAGTVYLPNFVMGNRIGLSATDASVHIGNALSGIVTNTTPDTSAGHTNPSDTSLVIGPANVIADNQGADNADADVVGDMAGIVITNASHRVKVVGNTIGLAEFPPGVPLNSTAYANAGDGIVVTSSANSVGPGNVVAANARNGVVVSGSATASTSVRGNWIGVSPVFSGVLTLGNGADGVHIDAASATLVGGPNASDANTIVANARNGIKLRNGGGDANGWGNLFQRNIVHGNATGGTGIDIDLEHVENAQDGPHAEIPANYANRDQASAEICLGTESSGPCVGSTAPTTGGGNTTVQWTMDTHGPADFRLEFFVIDAATTTAATSMTFLGEQFVSTDATGQPAGAGCTGGRCTTMLPGSAGGLWVVMTATDITALTDVAPGGTGWQAQLTCFPGNDGVVLSSCATNDTSEYAAAVAVAAAPPDVVTDAATAITDTAATLNGTVSANGAATTVSFEYGPTVGYGTTVAAAQSPLPADAIGASVTAAISGLTCGTTLHYRATANNGIGGTIDGNDQTFATAACTASAPTATTGIATAITATGAALNGVVSADGQTTNVKFEYGVTTAYGGVGSPLAALESPLSSGSSSAPVSVALNGLACNTTYHFRVDADNSIGAVMGADQAFTTAPCAAQPPTAMTTAANAITATTAVLNGLVSANGATTTVTFDYGLTTAYGGLGSPLTAAQSPLSSGAVNAAVSVTLAGLVCNTTYHFRVDANNGVGATVNGSDMSLTTAACPLGPTVATTAATAISDTGATLNGIVSANGAQTTVTFEYGTTTTYGGAGSPLVAMQSPLPPTASAAPVSASLTGLACNTAYHVRVDASNGVGPMANGNDIAFTTAACPAGAPTVVTGAASSITTSAATLHGSVSSNGSQTAVTFEYGLTSAYGGAGSPMTAVESPLPPATNNAAVTASLSGLACNTAYHYRVDADNGVGALTGSDQTFTTSACPTGAPSATTGIASAVTASGATLNGTVSSNGVQTVVTFEFGTTAAYGAPGSPATAQESPLDATAMNAPVSAMLSGLTCATIYHFRVVADNSAGTVDGADQTFTTSACAAGAPTATTVAASAITATTATLNGLVSANGAQTTVTFEYGTTPAYGGAGSPLAATQSPLPPTSVNAAVSAPLAGLSCGTTYHVRVDANNGNGGPVTGSDVTFATSACPAGTPTAATGAASAISATSATLNGTVSSNGAATTVTFEYGTTAAYGGAGSPLAAAQSPLPANAVNAPVSAVLSGLTCNTTFHFRVDANNAGSGGTVMGADKTFTTSACPPGTPTATTGAANAITATSATLNGAVTSNGATTDVAFDYGTTVAYGGSLDAAQSPLPANAVTAPVSTNLAGLTCGTAYHFRVTANNGLVGTGADRTFTTAACTTPQTTFSGPTFTHTGIATAQIAGGGASCGFATAALVGAPASPPQGVTFPDGLFDFTTSGCTGPVTVTVTFPTAFAPGEEYWKFGAEPAQPSPHWYPIGAGQNLSLSGHVATFVLIDGAMGDDDGTANGSIRDPGGPGFIRGGGGGGGGGGNEAVSTPTLGEVARMLLVAIMLLLGAYAASQRPAAARPERSRRV